MSDEKEEVGLRVYEQLCTNIRTTDEISFSLLRLVPILSGTGIGLLTVLEKQQILNSTTAILIAIVAALLTFGLFRWELRNIQTCSWLIKRAADLERVQFKLESFGLEKGQFQAREHAPPLAPLFGTRRVDASGNPIRWSDHPIGKTEAEKIVYVTAIAAWIVPVVAALA